jgi:transcriptional regulator with XRE-family HTH domain
VATEIGVGPATLLRVESGRIPDVSTFGRICQWLGVEPSVFLGSSSKAVLEPGVGLAAEAIQISAHFRADQTPKPETMQALAQMLIYAARVQPQTPDAPIDEHA